MFLALKELSYAKFKYLLIGCIMAAILFLVFFINGLANGLSEGDSSSLANLPADFVLMNADAEGDISKSEISADDQAMIDQQIDASQSTPFVMQYTSVKKEGKKTDAIFFAVGTDHKDLPQSIEGKNIQQLTGNEIVADVSLKQLYGYQLNDVMTDDKLNQQFKVVGFVEHQTYSMMPVMYTDLQFWQDHKLLQPGKYNAILYYGDKQEIQGFNSLTKEEAVTAMPGYTETQGSFTMMLSCLFFISAFVSTVFFYVITIQKTHQFGVFKAVGANTGYIARSIVLQVFLITVFGFVLSMLAILGMSQVLPVGMPFVLSNELLIRTGVIFLVLNLAGSLISVYKVSKVDALQAIGRVD